MDNLAEYIHTEATTNNGRVIAAGPDDGTLVVLVGPARHHARIAPSCLLLPLVGDHVLLGSDTSGFVILAVTERTTSAPSTLRAKELHITANTLRVHSKQAAISAEQLSLAARTVTVAGAVLRFVGNTITQTAELVTSTAQRHLRRSSVRDDVHSASAAHHCDGVHETRADAMVTLGRRVVRVDGGQIQIG